MPTKTLQRQGGPVQRAARSYSSGVRPLRKVLNCVSAVAKKRSTACLLSGCNMVIISKSMCGCGYFHGESDEIGLSAQDCHSEKNLQIFLGHIIIIIIEDPLYQITRGTLYVPIKSRSRKNVGPQGVRYKAIYCADVL